MASLSAFLASNGLAFALIGFVLFWVWRANVVLNREVENLRDQVGRIERTLHKLITIVRDGQG